LFYFIQNKALYDAGQFQNNEVMIENYYDDTKNVKLFIRFFTILIVLIK